MLAEPYSADLGFNFFALIGPFRLEWEFVEMDAVRLSQMALRAFATVYGTLGILCVCASFVAPRAALYAILNLGTATAITLALEDGK